MPRAYLPGRTSFGIDARDPCLSEALDAFQKTPPPRSASSHRHTLLQQRGAPIAAIDMELNVVRSELHAFYETGRLQQRTPTPMPRATHIQFA
ncbi:MAG: hypothetical protein ACYDB0_08680 [Acidithiobacillus sp.]